MRISDWSSDVCSSDLEGRGVLRVDLGEEAPFEVTVGGPGDQLFVGDWNCDGVDRPALYRPADGSVVYLDAPQMGAAGAAEALAPPESKCEGVTDEAGCDSLTGATETGSGHRQPRRG